MVVSYQTDHEDEMITMTNSLTNVHNFKLFCCNHTPLGEDWAKVRPCKRSTVQRACPLICGMLPQWWKRYARVARCALVLVSDEYFRSPPCIAELRYLQQHGTHIIPIKMSAFALPDQFDGVLREHLPRSDRAAATSFDPKNADHMEALCNELDRHDLRA